MFVTKLKLTSVLVLFLGIAGAAGVLAQVGSRPNAGQQGDQVPGSSAAGSRRGAGADVVHGQSQTPAYIAQSRALIVTRLEEEVAEARARLDRTMRKFPSSDDPAVVRARETLEGLVQRLDRIDRVLVDVVETYPTMVDFSGGPAGADSDGQTRVGSSWNNVKHARWFEGQKVLNRQQRPEGTQNDRRSQDQIDIFRDTAAKNRQPINHNDPRPQGATRMLRVTRQTAIRKPDNKGKVSRPMHGTTARSPDRMANSNPATHRRTNANQGSQSKGEPTGGKQSDSSQRSQSDGKSRDNQGSKSKEERQGGKESDSSERSQSDGKSRDPRAQNGKHDNAKNPGHGSGFVTADLDGDGQPEIYYNKWRCDRRTEKPSTAGRRTKG